MPFTGYKQSEEHKQKRLQKSKEAQNKPEVKERQRRNIKIALNKPEIKEKHLKSMNNPLVKEKLRQSSIKMFKDINFKERHKQLTKIGRNKPEVKEKHLEIMNSQEVLNKISGKNSVHWIEGLDREYCQIFSNKEFRKMIFERDHYTCQNCGLTRMLSLKIFGTTLCIHHIDYNKKECKQNNLITTCFSCNSKANNNRVMWKTFYLNLMKGK